MISYSFLVALCLLFATVIFLLCLIFKYDQDLKQAAIDTDRLHRHYKDAFDDLQRSTFVHDVTKTITDNYVKKLEASEEYCISLKCEIVQLKRHIAMGIAFLDHTRQFASDNKTKVWQMENCIDNLEHWIEVARKL